MAGNKSHNSSTASDQKQQGENFEIPDHKYDRWEDFKSNFSQILFEGEPFSVDKYLFRGHSDVAWKLEPTFDRMFREQSMKARLKIASDTIEHFRAALERAEIPEEAYDTETKLMALAQHYGLPTRLLDWTESPYIAAFFAFNSSALWGIEDNYVVVWVLDQKNPVFTADYGVEVIDAPSRGNARLRNQSGKFTLSRTPFATLEEYCEYHTNIVGTPLRKFRIRAAECDKALADLDSMGIHHGNVYPDNEGAAQWALFRTVRQHNVTLSKSSTCARPA